MKTRSLILLSSFTVWFMLLSWDASADSSCYDPFESLSTQAFPPLTNEDHVFPLNSTNSHGSFRTKAVMHLTNLGLNGFQVWFQFPASTGMVSLPYDLFRVEIQDLRGTPLFKYDLTADCKNAGASLFPRQEIRLPPFKIPLSQVKLLDIKQILIKVWGRL